MITLCCEVTPKGYPRMVIYRAFHFPNCKGNGDLKITILEGKQIQKNLGYTFDQKASGIDKDSLTKLGEKQDGNTTNDGIPPKPKDLGILPTII